MKRYGQYCPLAHALEILGDRWTLLIIRDLIKGIRHFNDLERGLPGISRGVLAKRLRHLEQAGLVEKRHKAGRQSTEYHLTEAGAALEDSIHALWLWGRKWVFGEPSLEELDSALLMWRMHKEINHEQLPQERVVVQFDFYGAERSSYWLVLKPDDVSLCLTDPGFEINVLVTADLVTFFKVWAEHISYHEALAADAVRVEGMPHLTRAFPRWFAWGTVATGMQHA
jgi:DNA-binding HxlR family transcriptional regulator